MVEAEFANYGTFAVRVSKRRRVLAFFGYRRGMAWLSDTPAARMQMNRPEFIACSAVWYQDGKERIHNPRNVESGLVVYGIGHHHCFALLGEMFPKREYLAKYADGFMTSHCRFVDRKEGMEIARLQNQLNDEYQSADLYSENIFY